MSSDASKFDAAAAKLEAAEEPAKPTAQQSRASGPKVPDIEVRYEDISWSIPLTTQTVREGLPDVLSSIATSILWVPVLLPYRILSGLGKPKPKPEQFRVLDGVSGVIRPGTMTL